MSDDPKTDLLYKSGPLGTASNIPTETIKSATGVQATIMWQNEEQLRRQGEMNGKLDAFNIGAHERMTTMEKRIAILEEFNARLLILPRAIYWLVGVLGLDGLFKLGHLIGILH